MSLTRMAPIAWSTTAASIGFAFIMALCAAAPLRAQRDRYPPPAEPFAAFLERSDTIYWLSIAPFSVRVKLGPKEATRKDVLGGARRPLDEYRNLYTAVIDTPSAGEHRLTALAINGPYHDSDARLIIVENPRLRGERVAADGRRSNGIDAWEALEAHVGDVYDPSSDLIANNNIPASHYQTIVTIRGHEVLNRRGLVFHNLPADLQHAMTVSEDARPEDIVTRVFWRPGGTPEVGRWKLLLCNQPDQGAAIPLERRRMRITAAGPRLNALQRFYVATIDPEHLTWRSPPFDAVDGGSRDARDMEAIASCAECDQYGIDVELHDTTVLDVAHFVPRGQPVPNDSGTPSDTGTASGSHRAWMLVLRARDAKMLATQRRDLNGKQLDVSIGLVGSHEETVVALPLVLVVNDE